MRTRTKRKEHPSSTSPLTSVIIPAMNEASTISKVIGEARKIGAKTEVIVVCNGSTDHTVRLAEKAGAKVVYCKHALGHDVGRAIGAKFATGDVLIFIDADFMVPATILRKYRRDVEQGWDVVLNAYSGFKTKLRIHATSEAKRLLNKLVGRPDLEGSSLAAVPHAISRKALEVIGWQELAVPPKAHVKAILGGLKVKRDHYVYTPRLNKKRTRRQINVEQLLLGDHAEAIAYLVDQCGERAGFTDLSRMRFVVTHPEGENVRELHSSEPFHDSGFYLEGDEESEAQVEERITTLFDG